jgi:hypothetical protein
MTGENEEETCGNDMRKKRTTTRDEVQRRGEGKNVPQILRF